MKVITSGVAVACMVVIILQSFEVVANEDTTVPGKLRFFFWSLFRPLTTGTSNTSPNVTNGSFNTYLTILNSSNVSGISIVPRLRISREDDSVANLEFLDDRGRPTKAIEVPESYYEVITNIMKRFNQQIGLKPLSWDDQQPSEDDEFEAIRLI